VQDFLVEILAGAQWVDITSDVRQASGLAITRGRPDEGGRSDPGRCDLVINNGTGRYSPRNPVSDLYGLIGRNTPLHAWVRGPESHFWPRATSARARVASSSALDVASDLDVRVELALQRVPRSGTPVQHVNEVIGRYATSGDQRMWRLMINEDGRPEIVWSTTGADLQIRTADAILPVRPSQRIAVRATLDVDNGAGGHVARFYYAPSIDDGTWTQIGQPIVTAGTTSINQSGVADLQLADISSLGFGTGFGRYYRAQLRDGIDGPLLADSDMRALTPGVSTWVDSVGRTWEIEGDGAISDWYLRFAGHVRSWPVRWDVSGRDVWSPIQARGPLLRMSQGAAPLQSTLRRRIGTAEPPPLVYWPCEDGADSSSAASALPGGSPLAVSGWEFAADTTLPGASVLPRLTDSASMSGRVPSAAPGEWWLELVYRLDEMPATETTMLEIRSTGTWATLRITVQPENVRVYGENAEGTATTLLVNALAEPQDFFVGSWNRLRIRERTISGTPTLEFGWLEIGGGGGLFTAGVGTIGRLTRISSPFGPELEGLRLGHISAWTADPSTYYNFADHGFENEPAVSRVRRLAAEEQLRLSAIGIPAESQALGSQSVATLLDLLQEAADADGGVLYELRDTIGGLHYLPQSALYSRPSDLVLDYEAGHLAPPLEPTGDDYEVTNHVEVSRRGGSSAVAVRETGPMSVQEPPDGIGLYTLSSTLNVAGDEQLPGIAGWRLHLGTWDEERYPVVRLNLVAPQLAALRQAILDQVDVAAVVRIVNPPPWLPPGDITLLTQGYRERIDSVSWDMELNCSPAGPWTVGHVAPEVPAAADLPQHVDTDGSELATGVDATATELLVAAGRYEDFEDADLLLDITAGGDAPWARDDSTAHTGTWSLRSGAITHDQMSDAVVAVPPESRELRFWYRVDSEELFDFFRVLVDGEQVLAVSGDTGWVQSAVIPVAGATTVTFRYAKDDIVTEGADAAWIDGLSFISGPTWSTDPTDVPWDVTVGGERMTVTSVTGADSPQTWTVTRSVNGVVKSHAAGADVRLADPMIVAL
jgi:hypothetical protein